MRLIVRDVATGSEPDRSAPVRLASCQATWPATAPWQARPLLDPLSDTLPEVRLLQSQLDRYAYQPICTVYLRYEGAIANQSVAQAANPRGAKIRSSRALH